MTDDEFDAVMEYEKQHERLKYTTKQYVSLGEAMKIFQENIYELAMDTNNMDLLYQFKKFRSGSYLDKDKAKAFPIGELMIRCNLPVRFNKIICPFHEDKTPSLSLDVKNNRWKCFGCNKKGDVIDFVMGLQNISFTQAVKQLI